MWSPSTLLIVDPNLGAEAASRLSPICDDISVLCWDVAAPGGKDAILARIADGRYALAISFYSDLILSRNALAAIDLPLNIHPALPPIRGVGHDVVPLVERHATVGATLHRMDPLVDTGEIFDTLEAPLPPEPTYTSLRALNQQLSLRMLDRLCSLMQASGNLAQLSATLSACAAASPRQWGAYYSRETIAVLRAAHGCELGSARN